MKILKNIQCLKEATERREPRSIATNKEIRNVNDYLTMQKLHQMYKFLERYKKNEDSCRRKFIWMSKWEDLPKQDNKGIETTEKSDFFTVTPHRL